MALKDFLDLVILQERSYAEAGHDLRYNLEITLEEAAKGVEKTIKYKEKWKM